MAVAAAVGVPLCVAALKGYFLFHGGVRGAYFSIVTLAFVLVTNQVAISWRDVTGGDTGLTGVPGLKLPFGAFTLDFTSREGRFQLAVVVLAVGLGVSLLVGYSSFGLVLAAIREDEDRARFLGYDTAWYLTAVLTVSAAMAGLAGGAFAAVSTLAAPDMVDAFLSIEILTWVAVGGRGHLAGALVGTAVMRLLNDELATELPQQWPLVVGLFFIVVVLFLPAGIVGSLTNWRRWLTRPSRRRATA